MADALVERTTGTPGGISGVEIQLVITDRTLFQGDAEPARLPGYGTVPAGWALERIGAGTERQGPGLQDLAPPALHPPRHRRARGDGLPRPALPARAPPLHPDQRRHLPNPLLRRPHPPPGPHHSLAHRRPDHHGQRRRTLRSLQPHQRNPRLESTPQPKPHPDPPRASARGTPSNSPPPPATRTVPRRRPCPDRLPAKRAWIPAAGAVMSATARRRSRVCGPQAHWRPERRTGHKPSRAACTKKPPADRNDQRAALGQLVGGL